jgi:hypothetical protein
MDECKVSAHDFSAIFASVANSFRPNVGQILLKPPAGFDKNRTSGYGGIGKGRDVLGECLLYLHHFRFHCSLLLLQYSMDAYKATVGV